MDQSFTDFEIIFVDNNSSDGSVEFVEGNFTPDKIKLFKTGKNLGFAGGNNFGLKHCIGEYIVLLNNDTVVEKDWLKNLIECLKTDDQTGIAQSLVITEGIPAKYYEKNGTINLLGHNIMEVFNISKRRHRRNISGERDVHSLSGRISLMSSAVYFRMSILHTRKILIFVLR